LREREDKPSAAQCHACGRSYVYQATPRNSDDSGRFCSARCRDTYDAGLPAYDPIYGTKSDPRNYSLPMGRRGFLIDCANCGKRFDSVGLRCCTPKCEKNLARKGGQGSKTVKTSPAKSMSYEPLFAGDAQGAFPEETPA